jgi:VanZ family protein
MSKKIIFYLPMIFWMCFIFFLSSQQTTSIQGTYNQRFVILKFFHLVEYSILAILAFIAVRKYKVATIIAYIYAVTDEIHQYFVPGRTSKFTDTLIDLIGISIGIIVLRKIFKFPR